MDALVDVLVAGVFWAAFATASVLVVLGAYATFCTLYARITGREWMQ